MTPTTTIRLQSIAEVHPVIIFDGVCMLCHGFVAWLIRRDTAGRFRFATIQSSTGQDVLSANNVRGDTVVLLYAGSTYTYSDVAIQSARLLGGIWSVALVLKVVPKGLRDAVYRWVARNRYRWYGKYEVCPLPPTSVRKRFIDI